MFYLLKTVLRKRGWCLLLRLSTELATKILNEVKTLTSEQLIIVDGTGVIISSTDPIRVGHKHEGAQRVLKTNERLNITVEMATFMEGVKPGINLPITFNKNIVGVLGITGKPVDVEPFAELICRMTELMIREAYYLEKKAWETHGMESFFHEWIFAKKIDDEFINRGTVLGISFHKPYQCILMQLDHTLLSVDKKRQLENEMNDWFYHVFSKETDDFFVRWGDGRFMLIKNCERPISDAKLLYELSRWQKYIKNKHNIPLAIGIGKTITEKIIAQSYKEANKALKVAESNGNIIFYNTLLLELILEDISETTRTEYIERMFSTLNKEPVLLETLKTFLDCNQSLKKSAAALHIHINTLHYRLKQIKELTTINPKTTVGLTKFYLAFSLMEKERDI